MMIREGTGTGMMRNRREADCGHGTLASPDSRRIVNTHTPRDDRHCRQHSFHTTLRKHSNCMCGDTHGKTGARAARPCRPAAVHGMRSSRRAAAISPARWPKCCVLARDEFTYLSRITRIAVTPRRTPITRVSESSYLPLYLQR